MNKDTPKALDALSAETLIVGGFYNWKGQPERLVYMGLCEPRNGHWHQFAKVDEPGTVWCEVRNADLSSFEVTQQAAKSAAASAPAYAPAGSAPRTSCRLFVGLGGTSTGGSLSGGIPIGNDQICVSGAQFEFMDKINAMAPRTFSAADYLRAACKVEGMSESAACKPDALRAQAILDGADAQAGKQLLASQSGG